MIYCNCRRIKIPVSHIYGLPGNFRILWIDDFTLTKAVEKDPLKKQLAEEWINMVLLKEYQLENIAELSVQFTKRIGMFLSFAFWL